MSHPSPAILLSPYVLMGIALALTIGICAFAHAPLPRHGPDRAGLEAFYLLVCPLRWLTLALLLGVVIHRGGFAWLGRNAVVPWLAVFVLHIGAGFLSVCSLVALRSGETLARTGAWIFGYATPVVLMVYALAAVLADPDGNGAPIWARGLIVFVAIATAVGGVVGGREYRKEKREATARRVTFEQEESEKEERRKLEEQARVDAQLASLKTLAAGSSLGPLLDAISDGSQAVREAAAKLIGDRPTLRSELAALLQSDDRVRALKYVWWRMDPPPRELAQPFRDCISSMPDWTRRTLAVLDETHATEVNWACEAIVILAGRFAGSNVDFRPPIAALSALLEKDYAFEGFRARALLKDWLERQPKS